MTSQSERALRHLARYLLAAEQLGGDRLDEVRDPSLDLFYTQYVYLNRPVLLPGLVASWPAIGRWTFEFLAAELGEVEVRVSGNRLANGDYEAQYDRHQRTMAFRTLLAHAAQGGPSNDLYLVGKGDFFKTPGAEALLVDVPPPSLLGGLIKANDAVLWLGPAGTLTPLHRDGNNVLLCQVRGEKSIHLISSLAAPWLAPAGGGYSDFDPAQPDFGRFPALREIQIFRTKLSVGDALLIPAGWWHKVVADTPSISVSYTSFRLPKLPSL